MDQELKPHLPLPPATLHILLCLAGEPRHGYGIMQEVMRESRGQYKLGPGTLYDNLDKLMENGLVTEAPQPPDNDDARRRYYSLTEFGRTVLAADVDRLKEVVHMARVRLKVAEGRQ
jgi:DNA-binding PadR family transcriptional regulator